MTGLVRLMSDSLGRTRDDGGGGRPATLGGRGDLNVEIGEGEREGWVE